MFKFYNDANLIPNRIIMESPKAFFENYTIFSDIVKSEDYRKLVYEVEQSTISEDGLILITKKNERIPITLIANGLKTLGNLMFLSKHEIDHQYVHPNSVNQVFSQVVNFTYCGENAVGVLLREPYLQKYNTREIFSDYCCFGLSCPNVDIEFNGEVMTCYTAANLMMEVY
jgi:hypothetical protein